MAAANWPSAPTLPQGVLLDTMRFLPGDGRAINRPDYGPSMIRLRTQTQPDVLTGDMMMSDAQFTSFQTFVNTTLVKGSLPFYFPHHETGAATLAQFGRGYWSYVRLSGNKVRVTLEIEYVP